MLDMDLKIVILSLALLTFEVYGLMFDLQPNGRKCLREEVQKDALVTGDYEISEVPGQRTDLKVSVSIFTFAWLVLTNLLLRQVTDSKGHTLVNNEDKNKGKFAFTTDDYEVFEICFISKVAPSNY